MTKAQMAELIAPLRASGLSERAIGLRIGVSGPRVHQICRLFDIPKPQTIIPKAPIGRPKSGPQ